MFQSGGMNERVPMTLVNRGEVARLQDQGALAASYSERALALSAVKNLLVTPPVRG